MLEISTDLQVNQPTVTMIGNTFVSIENYLSIITFESDLIIPVPFQRPAL